METMNVYTHLIINSLEKPVIVINNFIEKMDGV